MSNMNDFLSMDEEALDKELEAVDERKKMIEEVKLMRNSEKNISALLDVHRADKKLLKRMLDMTPKQVKKFMKYVPAGMQYAFELYDAEAAKTREESAERNEKRRAKKNATDASGSVTESENDGANSDATSVTESIQSANMDGSPSVTEGVQTVREVSDEELQKAFPDGDDRYDPFTHRTF